MLNLINKIETIVNKGLWWLMAQYSRAWKKFCPSKIQNFFQRIHDLMYATIPAFFRKQLQHAKSAPKEILKIDFKGLFSSALSEGLSAFHEIRKKSPLKAVWAVVTVPVVFIAQWTKSLHPIHSFILVSFTVGSLFSAVVIGKTSYRLFLGELGLREPAAVDGAYIRPDYYKKETRRASLSSVKIPAIIEGVNGLRSVMIDVSFLASNRETKKILDKSEFQLRDHLIANLEPVLPAFALTDEGRAMLKEKLELEVNQYLKDQEAPGFIEETHIIHILAH
jgi:hypothetical protein